MSQMCSFYSTHPYNTKNDPSLWSNLTTITTPPGILVSMVWPHKAQWNSMCMEDKNLEYKRDMQKLLCWSWNNFCVFLIYKWQTLKIWENETAHRDFSLFRFYLKTSFSSESLSSPLAPLCSSFSSSFSSSVSSAQSSS